MSSDDDSNPPKTVKSKELKKRIEGFGSAPPPANDNPADVLWGRVSEDPTFTNWYDSARSSVNAVLDAVDDTVNAIADAVDDTIAAVLGEDDDPEVVPGTSQRGGEGGSGRTSGDGTAKKKKKKVDTGERSGVDWQKAVDAICVEGDLETFVLTVRGQVKNEFEEREVGGLLADALLNEVKAGATLRILHVLEAVVSDENLPHAQEVLKSRCATKLVKLQASPCFAKLSTDILGDHLEKEKKEKEEKAAREAAASSEPPKAPAPAVPTADLLDMSSPQVKPNPAPNGSGSSSSKAKVSVKPQETEDLIGLAVADKPVPALAPPKAASGQLRRGMRVQAVWAGDGKVYPAVVEHVRGRQVEVNWMRRSATSTAAETFVCDIGDDTTHELVKIEDVRVSGGARAGQSGPADLLDLGSAPAAAPTSPPKSPADGALAGLSGLSFTAGAGSGPGVDLFAQVNAGAAASANPSGAWPAGSAQGFAFAAAAPPAGGAASAPSRPGGYIGGPAAAGPSSGYAAAFGGLGGAAAPMGGGSRQAPAPKILSPTSAAKAAVSVSSAKDLQLGDAFELAGVR